MLLFLCLELLWTALTPCSGPFHHLCFNRQCGHTFRLLSPNWDCLGQEWQEVPVNRVYVTTNLARALNSQEKIKVVKG